MAGPKAHLYRKFLFDKRVLTCVLCSTMVCSLAWLVILFDKRWFFIDIPSGMLRNSSGNILYRSQGGLFTVCETSLDVNPNEDGSYSLTKFCSAHNAPYKEDKAKYRLMTHYVRVEIAFTVLSVLLMFMSNGFAVYSLRHTRYMYKRLTAAVYLVAAATVCTVIQIARSIKDVHTNEKENINTISTLSFLICWSVFSVYIIAAWVFLQHSNKKNKGQAATDEIEIEDEPTILGR